jgi:hypothetical protein
MWLALDEEVDLDEKRANICLPDMLGAKYKRTAETENVKRFGTDKMWNHKL